MKITNIHGLSLPLAVWLLHDDYDYINEPNYISATSLLKSTKQVILSKRVPYEDKEMDVADLLASSFGHATHDSIEKAWRMSGVSAMKKLGYSDNIADNVRVNPSQEELAANLNIIPIWIEQRAFREIAGFKIGGKFDMVMDGRLFDFKTTSVYAFIMGNKDDDYSMQGSIYRWLNPDLVKDPYIYINFLFTDWQKSQARRDPKYPQVKAKEHPVLMHSIQDTETFIVAKLQELARLWNAPEEQLPPCTDKELWRSEPQYKYYANPEKTARSTKNFDTLAEANAFMAQAGGKGIVKTIPGEVKACDYCPAFSICKQKDQYYVE